MRYSTRRRPDRRSQLSERSGPFFFDPRVDQPLCAPALLKPCPDRFDAVRQFLLNGLTGRSWGAPPTRPFPLQKPSPAGGAGTRLYPLTKSSAATAPILRQADFAIHSPPDARSGARADHSTPKTCRCEDYLGDGARSASDRTGAAKPNGRTGFSDWRRFSGGSGASLSWRNIFLRKLDFDPRRSPSKWRLPFDSGALS